MTIDIVRVKPNKREGAQGEIRLLLAGEGVSQNRLMSGAVLMVKAGNDWHSVAMVPTLSQLNHIRKELENLRRQIIQVTDADGDGYDGEGTLVTTEDDGSSYGGVLYR